VSGDDGRGRLGRWGEREAARVLRRRGLRVLERNVVLPGGEIDLVAVPRRRRRRRCRDSRDRIVIVEVKTRLLRSAGDERRPEAALVATKRARLLRLARRYAHRRGRSRASLGIDVVAIDARRRRGWLARWRPFVLVAVRHHESAVRDERRGIGTRPSGGYHRTST